MFDMNRHAFLPSNINLGTHVKKKTGFIVGTCTCCQLYEEYEFF